MPRRRVAASGWTGRACGGNTGGGWACGSGKHDGCQGHRRDRGPDRVFMFMTFGRGCGRSSPLASKARPDVAGFASAGRFATPTGSRCARRCRRRPPALSSEPLLKLTRLTAVLAASALALASLSAIADVPAAQNVPFPGSLKITVDATDVARRIFRVHEVIPAQPGPLTLLYPQWLPGNHSPTGPIDKLAGLVVTANGKTLAWKRDSLNVYAFHVEVPAGATQVEAEFQYLSPQDRRQGRVVMTPEMLNLQWNAVTLYPAGYYARRINTEPSVKLPAGWQAGTALEVASRDGDTIHFKPIDYENLVDSPIYAGKYFKRLDLDPGAKAPVHMDIVADA